MVSYAILQKPLSPHKQNRQGNFNLLARNRLQKSSTFANNFHVSRRSRTGRTHRKYLHVPTLLFILLFTRKRKRGSTVALSGLCKMCTCVDVLTFFFFPYASQNFSFFYLLAGEKGSTVALSVLCKMCTKSKRRNVGRSSAERQEVHWISIPSRTSSVLVPNMRTGRGAQCFISLCYLF